jgi:Ser-tRNA(Ala) deacylase AlaX
MDDRMTARLFLDDATLATTSAVVITSWPDGIVLDRTVFAGMLRRRRLPRR